MFLLDAIPQAAAILVLVPALTAGPVGSHAPSGMVRAGSLAAEDSAGAAPHPLPRVKVDVEKVRGPRDANKVQAKLRSTLWGSIVSCYAEQAQHNQKLRGDALIRIEVDRHGKVIGTRRRGGDMPSAAVVQCWRRMLRKVELPQARRGASVDVRIWIAPGDQPVRAPSRPARK